MEDNPIDYNQEAIDYARQNFVDEFQDIQKELQHAFETIPEEDVPRIDEVMFREVFLPFFANDENKKYPTVTMNHWATICGNLMSPVYIVNAKGEVVLTVPPVYDRTILHIADPLGTAEEEDRPRINHVWKTVSLMRQHSPRQAELYFADMISGRLLKEGVEIAIIKHAESWNKIYEYYGREIPYPKMREWLKAVENNQPIESSQNANSQTQSRRLDDQDGVEYELV